jgi:hypothetical protein
MAVIEHASFFLSRAYPAPLDGLAPRLYNTSCKTASEAFKVLEDWNYTDTSSTCTVFSCTLLTASNNMYFNFLEVNALKKLAKAQLEAEALALTERIAQINIE